jgi:hypothetical protein
MPEVSNGEAKHQMNENDHPALRILVCQDHSARLQVLKSFTQVLLVCKSACQNIFMGEERHVRRPSIALWWLASNGTSHNIFPHFSGMVRMLILMQVSGQHSAS